MSKTRQDWREWILKRLERHGGRYSVTTSVVRRGRFKLGVEGAHELAAADSLVRDGVLRLVSVRNEQVYRRSSMGYKCERFTIYNFERADLAAPLPECPVNGEHVFSYGEGTRDDPDHCVHCHKSFLRDARTPLPIRL